MGLHAALAATATLLSLAFALCTLERWLDRHKRHEAVWTVSLFMFAIASAALWAGAAFGWDEPIYRVFYLFGAVLNVPFLALGTVYLLAGQRIGDRTTAVVSLLAAFAAGVVVAAPFVAPIDADVLPRGSEVFPPGPRIAAAVASSVPAMVIIIGALWSAGRAWRQRNDASPAPRALSPVRLALANLCIASGTIVLGLGGLSNSVLDAMDTFAMSLVLGIALIFGGFLLTSTPPAPPPVAPWFPPERSRATGPVPERSTIGADLN